MNENQVQKIWEKHLSETAKVAKKAGQPNLDTPEIKTEFISQMQGLDFLLNAFESGQPNSFGISKGKKNTLKNKLVNMLAGNMITGAMHWNLIVEKPESPHKYINDPKGDLISIEARDHFINRYLLESSQYYKKLEPAKIFYIKQEAINLGFYLNRCGLYTANESLEKLGDSNLKKRLQFLYIITMVNARNTLVHFSKEDIAESKREELINLNKLSDQYTGNDSPLAVNKQLGTFAQGILGKWEDMARTFERMKFGYDDIHIWDLVVDPRGLIDRIKIKPKETPHNFLKSLFGLK